MNASAENEPSAPGRRTPAQLPSFMSVKQVAEYLQINEKKIYALIREQKIPATKVTGKWLFPRELVDRWLLQSSHGGLLTDRLVICGGDDPLLYHIVLQLAQAVGARALVSYSPTGARLGLDLLSAQRADVGCVHWGPVNESHLRHPALLQQYPAHRNWILVRAFVREQGLLVRRDLLPQYPDVSALLFADLRWVERQTGAGTRRFLHEILASHGVEETRLRTSVVALSEREAAAQVAMGNADISPGIRASATEFGLEFVRVGREAFDLALGRGVYFRTLFQTLADSLHSSPTRAYAERLGGYDFSTSGDIVWGLE